MAPGVHQAAVGDREHPSSTLLVIAVHAMCIPGDVEEDLTEHILGIWYML